MIFEDYSPRIQEFIKNIGLFVFLRFNFQNLTEEEITVLENELFDELKDSIDIELESLRLQIESETIEAFDHLEVEDYDDTNEDLDFYREGEEDLETMFRN